jgi:hypothetical protein
LRSETTWKSRIRSGVGEPWSAIATDIPWRFGVVLVGIALAGRPSCCAVVGPPLEPPHAANITSAASAAKPLADVDDIALKPPYLNSHRILDTIH